VKVIRRIRKKQADRSYFLLLFYRLLCGTLAIYIVFNFLWGLNYNRPGMGYQLGLDPPSYNDTDLVNVTRELANRMNALQPYSRQTREELKKKKVLFSGSISAYRHLSEKNAEFHYSYPSIKPSIYSYLGNYLGFTGYYNPFTGEAQVNTTIPPFIRPFTSCHEIGHQLGYAKESEANFAAYLSAGSSLDSAFLYSIYFELYAYAARYLYSADSMALKQINVRFSPEVKADIKEIREFFTRYDNPLETAVDRIYSQYLKANEQPSGRMSYNEVVGMLIAWHKKYGKI
jgi:hypothetical protein